MGELVIRGTDHIVDIESNEMEILERIVRAGQKRFPNCRELFRFPSVESQSNPVRPTGTEFEIPEGWPEGRRGHRIHCEGGEGYDLAKSVGEQLRASGWTLAEYQESEGQEFSFAFHMPEG